MGRNRREFIVLLGCAAAGSGAAHAQQTTKIPRIALLSPFAERDTVAWHQAFRRGLESLGWFEGKNINIEYRYAGGRNDRLPALIDELKNLKVDVIVTSVTNDTLEAKKPPPTFRSSWRPPAIRWRPESCRAWRGRAVT